MAVDNCLVDGCGYVDCAGDPMRVFDTLEPVLRRTINEGPFPYCVCRARYISEKFGVMRAITQFDLDTNARLKAEGKESHYSTRLG